MRYLLPATVCSFLLALSIVVLRPRVAPAAPAAEALSTRLSVYDKTKAYPGFTLYPIEGNAEVHLLDMTGRIVHRWEVDAERARLLPNGRLLVTHGSNWGKNRAPWRNLRNIIREYAWDGSVAWEYKAEDTVARYFERLPNGNTIFLQRVLIPEDRVKEVLGPRAPKKRIRGDGIFEIDAAGSIQWSWLAHEHLDLLDCGKRKCTWAPDAEEQRDRDDWTHGNTASVIPPNQWHDAGDKRFAPGNILYMPRNFSQTLLLDRSTGDVVWRYNGDYKGGLGGGHEPLMIQKGLPGAGNVLIFDNWSAEFPKESHILEVNPVTKEIVWVFDRGTELFSETSGAVQRLPNGNTLISEDNRGRVLEVTPAKEIVWEYEDESAPEINRAQRYPLDYAPQFTKISQEP